MGRLRRASVRRQRARAGPALQRWVHSRGLQSRLAPSTPLPLQLCQHLRHLVAGRQAVVLALVHPCVPPDHQVAVAHRPASARQPHGSLQRIGIHADVVPFPAPDPQPHCVAVDPGVRRIVEFVPRPAVGPGVFAATSSGPPPGPGQKTHQRLPPVAVLGAVVSAASVERRPGVQGSRRQLPHGGAGTV